MSQSEAVRRFARRRSRAFRDARAQQEIQAFLISRPEDVSYLSGFTGEDSLLVVAENEAVLITDGRYSEQAEQQCPDLDLHVRSGSMRDAAVEVVERRELQSVAIQASHMTVHAMEQLAYRLGRKRVQAVTDVLSKQRAVKDDAEIEAIEKSIRVAEQAFRELIGEGRAAFVGRTEREVAADLEHRMVVAGASKASFETIVAAGAHGSLPHYRPGGTVIGEDDPVLIDWGAVVDGYCSDLTRVVFVGRIPPQLAEAYAVVRRAQQVAIEEIRTGLSGKGADSAARKVIERAGYKDHFLHGLGHGIGREIHEAPAMGRLSTTRLRKGMVVTAEPGIYLPGVGGIRIEDDVLVTEDGGRRLSALERDLSAMMLRPAR